MFDKGSPYFEREEGYTVNICGYETDETEPAIDYRFTGLLKAVALADAGFNRVLPVRRPFG